MVYKRILSVFIALGLLAVVFSIAVASDLGSPTYQDGMAMDTATFTPEPVQATSTPVPEAPQANATATPQLVDPLLQQPASTWGVMPMGAGGMMGGAYNTGVYTGTTGSMMGSCPMMSGMDMSGMGGMGMSGMSGMSGMEMGSMDMSGMDMSGVGMTGQAIPEDIAEYYQQPWYANPWTVIGWVLLALLLVAILAAAIAGVNVLVNHFRPSGPGKAGPLET